MDQDVPITFGKSLGLCPRDFPRLRQYFIVYPSSRHNTVTIHTITTLHIAHSFLHDLRGLQVREELELGLDPLALAHVPQVEGHVAPVPLQGAVRVDQQ